MSADGQLLAQDDIDSLLNEAGVDGGDEPEEFTEPDPEKNPPPKIKPIQRTEEDVGNAMAQIYTRAILKREESVRVIWNALGVLPMIAGIDVEIEGKNFLSLGVLQGKHLIVSSKN